MSRNKSEKKTPKVSGVAHRYYARFPEPFVLPQPVVWGECHPDDLLGMAPDQTILISATQLMTLLEETREEARAVFSSKF